LGKDSVLTDADFNEFKAYLKGKFTLCRIIGAEKTL
jgi:hypothetical protein